MNGDVRLITNDPAIVAGWNVEQVARFHFVDSAVGHGGGGFAANDEAHVFDLAFAAAGGGADVFRPAPAGFVAGTADGHASDVDDFKFAFRKGAGFVGFIKTFEND